MVAWRGLPAALTLKCCRGVPTAIVTKICVWGRNQTSLVRGGEAVLWYRQVGESEPISQQERDGLPPALLIMLGMWAWSRGGRPAGQCRGVSYRLRRMTWRHCRQTPGQHAAKSMFHTREAQDIQRGGGGGEIKACWSCCLAWMCRRERFSEGRGNLWDAKVKAVVRLVLRPV